MYRSAFDHITGKKCQWIYALPPWILLPCSSNLLSRATTDAFLQGPHHVAQSCWHRFLPCKCTCTYTPRYAQFKTNYNIICNIVCNVHVCVCVFAMCVCVCPPILSIISSLAHLLYLCRLTLSCLILPCLTLSCLSLPYLVFPYLVLSCLLLGILSYPILCIHSNYLPASFSVRLAVCLHT